MSPQSAQLDSLVSLISSSVEIVKAEYAKKGQIIPSLDSADSYPPDSEQPTLELKRAVQTLEGACAQLTNTVAPPAHTMINRSMGLYELACLRVVTETKVADHLKSSGDAGLALSELSTKTGIEVGKLGRILRLLATKHIFREVRKDVFANNRLSILLESDHEISSITGHFTEECFKSANGLFDTLSDPEYGSSYAPDKAAVTKVYGFEKGKGLFWWFSDVQPQLGERFRRGLIGWEKGTTAVALATAYPWSDLPASSTVTDVGGGVGNLSMDLARAFPHLKFIVQDLPATIAQGAKLWEKKYPEALQKQRVQFLPLDFFESPPVEGSDIYYLSSIVHNWPDKESVQILQNVRRAMKPSSKVLIHEYLLQHVSRVSEADSVFVQAPEPLLPNYGFGRVRQYNIDMEMMVMLNSKERTLDEITKLAEQAGLKFSKAYDTGETGIVEFSLA